MKLFVKVFVTLAIILLPISVLAQGYGKITGTVTDAATGDPLPFANVIVEEVSLGAATDVNGNFIILKVPSGKYDVSANFMGYQKYTIKGVQVLTDLTTSLDFPLTPSAVELQEEVVVVANEMMVRKDLTSTEARVTSEEIDNLPVQELSQVIDLQAGVNRDAGGDLHIRGGRSSEILYLVNGISVTDDFSRSQAIELETYSVQELQVISGSFNAEYGNAMSGVINYVTKTGSNEYDFQLDVSTGSYFTGHDDIFWNEQTAGQDINYNIQASLGGPVIKDKITFFTTVRRFVNGGYIYGIDRYSPQGRKTIINGDTVATPGSGKLTSMNPSERFSGQLSLETLLSTNLRLKVDAFGNYDKSKYYNHIYRLNPNGYSGNTFSGFSGFAKLSHNITNTTFHELSYAYRYNDSESKLYDDPFSPLYVHPDSANVPGFQFLRAGTSLNRFFRSTKSNIIKYELTSQVNNANLLKAGVDFQFDEVFYENINLVPLENELGEEIVPFVPSIRGIDSPQHDRFTRYPARGAAYIQDKLEIESLIINVGLRFDYFDPKGKTPADPSDPNIYNPIKPGHIYKDLNGDGDIGEDEQVDENKYTLSEKEEFWWNSTSVKTQLSPRLGIAYPITDRGIIRFSYGVFQQVPEYSLLYLGDQLKLTSSQGIQGPFGNPDLDPQSTTIYEIGLQQQLTDNFAMDITAFYRDIRDWISTSAPIPTFLAGTSYAIRANKDFANVSGVTLAVNKRFSNSYSFTIDYTYQVAEGTNSTPDQEFFAQVDGAEPTRMMTFLDWQQLHTVNATFFLSLETWGASLIAKYNTGQPYTPTVIPGAYTGRNIISGLTENSRNKPEIFNIDLEIFKTFELFSSEFQAYIKVFNLLDAKNPLQVFGDTGKPDYTLEEERAVNPDAGWFVYPNYYSEPRRFFIGMKLIL